MTSSVASCWGHALRTALGALAIGLVCAAPASGAWPGRNGVIVFQASQGYSMTTDNRPPTPGSGLLVIDPGTRRVRGLLTDLFTLYSPAFAADGRLAVGAAGDLLLTDLSGSARTYYRSEQAVPRRRGDPPAPAPLNISEGDLAWLPDGRFAWSVSRPQEPITGNVCQAMRHELRALRPGETTALTLRTATRSARGPAFSAVGGLMAYDGFDRETVEGTSSESCRVKHSDALWVQRVGAPRTARRLLRFRPQRLGSFHADFSPDGRRVALVTSRGVVVARVDGRGVRAFAGTRNAQSVVWSPDGRWLAVAIGVPKAPGRARLLLIPARGGPRRTIVDYAVTGNCSDCGVSSLAWQALPLR